MIVKDIHHSFLTLHRQTESSVNQEPVLTNMLFVTTKNQELEGKKNLRRDKETSKNKKRKKHFPSRLSESVFLFSLR